MTERNKRNIISSTELGEEDLFLKWNKNNNRNKTTTLTPETISKENQRLKEENKVLKEKVKYLNNLLRNEKVQYRELLRQKIGRK